MPQYRFTVVDAENRQFTGTTQAADREAALRYLAKAYANVVSFDEIHVRKPLFERGVTGDEVLALTQQMAAMLRSGLTLKRALDVLMGDMANPTLRRVLESVSADLSEGKQLSQALAEHPKVFPRLYVFMVQAGEAGGSLPEILAQLATYIGQIEGLKRRVKSALYYPVFILIVAFVISAFIFVFGVRQFQEIYAGFNAPLPLLTRVVMGAGNFAWQWWWVMVLVAGALGAGFAHYVRTQRGGMWFDQFLLNVPVLGPLLRHVAISRFARTLGSLYASGVPLLQALELVAASMENRVLEAVVLAARQNVKEGESISRPLRESGVFTPMSISMISSGEQSGSLEVMLREVADFYDSQIDAMLRGLVSLVEPAVICCVGVFVAVLIIALGLPMLNLVEILGK